MMLNLRREVNIMSQLSHPSIIKFHGYSTINFKGKAKPIIVTEFLNNGSLKDILEKERQGQSPQKWNNTKKLINIYGIASAMSYLHSKNIIHRDLKPENVLEDKAFYPKIADFGFSKKKHYNEESIQLSTQSIPCLKGTPAFIAPEGFNYEYIKAGDVYAFSMILYEIMTLEKPSSELNYFCLLVKIANDQRPEFKVPIPNCYRDLITRCWSKDPKDRPSFDQICSEIKNNKEFIFDGVNKRKFYKYIKLIDEFGIEDIDPFDEESIKNSESEKPSNSSEKLSNSSNISIDEKQLKSKEKLSSIFIQLSELECFTNLPIESQKFFKNSTVEHDQKTKTIKIQSKNIYKILVNKSFKSDAFMNSMKFFDIVIIEVDSNVQFYDQLFECISFWSSEKIQINLIISNIENIIGFIRKEKSSSFKILLDTSITSISPGALSDCSSIVEIIIPLSVTKIEAYAFSECKFLKKIIFQSKFTDIGIGSFRMCESLEEIKLPSFLTTIEDSLFFKCKKLIKISIPSSVKEIGNYAFSECSSLKKLSIPSSVIKINSYAFNCCSKLKKISIPSSVKEIASYSFYGCFSLEQIIIPSSVTEIGNDCFANCSLLKKISIPSSVTKIEDNVFIGCSNLKEIEIPSTLIEIKRNSFSKCKSLVSIIIPQTVKEIGMNAFSSCLALQTIKIPISVTKIENNSFNGCSSLKKISIPSSVTTIGWGSFNGCSSLQKIKIPKSVTEIGHYAFNECTSLQKITLPNSIEKIENNTFSKCSSLVEISIPSSVIEIGHYAFNECTSLKRVKIPSSVTSIGNFAFNGCALIDDLKIPSSVTSIGNFAFNGCALIDDLVIPSSVTSIGNFAFNGCALIDDLVIPSSVISIGNNAFNECSSIGFQMNSSSFLISSQSVNHYSIDDFDVMSVLGIGSYGKVQLVSNKKNGKLYALKSINKKIIEDTNSFQNIINERNILFKINHPFIVSAKFCFQNKEKIFIALDYVSGGNLASRVNISHHLPESKVRFYAAQIALAIGYIHKLGYIYRDIKPENILIDSDGYIKIADFSFARKDYCYENSNQNNNNSTFCGTFLYISPEMMSKKPYTKDVDWWSFGILVYEMLFGFAPFEGTNSAITVNRILNDDVLYPYNVDISKHAKMFINELLQKDPNKRLGNGTNDVEDIKNHQFFNGLNWEDLYNKILKPDWVPSIKNDIDVSMFDEKFIRKTPNISINNDPINSENQKYFVGFSMVKEDF